MSTHTRRGISPQRERNTEGQDKVCSTAQRGAIHGRKTDGNDFPFPKKPVSHRSSFSSKTQNSLDLFDFEKNPALSQEHHVDGNRETTASQRQIKDLHRLPNEEVQMAKAIHEKQLKLQEKLWRVEEKLKHKIQSSRAEAAAGKDERKGRGRGQPEQGQAQTKTKVLIQERKQQGHQNGEKMKKTHGGDGAGGRRGETEVAVCPQSNAKGIPQQQVSGELNKSRWENVKELSRQKWEENYDDVYGEAGVRLQHGTEKTQAQNKGGVGWTREEKHWERTNDEQKSACRQETENHRGEEHKTSRESSLPAYEDEELGLGDSTSANFQLLPCRLCNRKFAGERLEKHVQICKKAKQSHRQVFNSYANRTKGSALEEFLKTHTRSKTPEVLQKKNSRQNDKAKPKTTQHSRIPAGTPQSNWSK